MNLENLQFQQLDLPGTRTLLSWALAEGWNPGPMDADVFFNSDPNGFYGYFYNDELIAGGSIVSYNGEFGFMGLFIVKPEYRADGIGRRLWYQRRDTLLSRLNKGAAIGMDGVVTMQRFYAKGGFEIAFRDERYMRAGERFETDSHISPIYAGDVQEVLAFDTRCFGVQRPLFMMPWLQLPGNKTFKYVADGSLEGFAVVRKLTVGYKIGPLFANSFPVAEALYKACLDSVPEKKPT